jgi:hypothetical protein
MKGMIAMSTRKRPELHTPDGFRDFLPEEHAFKAETQRRLELAFHSYG